MNLYLSASAIQDYVTCPRRFYYRLYHSKEAEKSFAMEFGNLGHFLAEKYFEWEGLDDHDRLVFCNEFIKNNELLSRLSRQTVNDKILLYTKTLGNYTELLDKDDLVEKFFKIKYKDDLYFTGKLDRINPKTRMVIDWKTSKRLPPMLFDNNLQFIFYRRMYKELYGCYPSSMYLVSLIKPAMRTFKPNDYYESVVFNQLIPSIYNDWKKNSFPKLGYFKDKWICEYCSYKNFCSLNEE